MSGLKCVWNHVDCDGEVKNWRFIDTDVLIPTCEVHIEAQESIMTLHTNGYDIEEWLKRGTDEIIKEAKRLKE